MPFHGLRCLRINMRVLDDIYKIMMEMDTRQMIPSCYWDLLEVRLVIACRPPQSSKRRKISRSRAEVVSQHDLRKAYQSYSGVVDIDPYIFIPFILAVSPRICRTFDLSEFLRDHAHRNRIHLGKRAKDTLEEIARKYDIGRSYVYQRLIAVLFSAPPSAADSESHYFYGIADIIATGNNFPGRIYEGVMRARLRVEEAIGRTTCVRMKLPVHGFLDSMIYIDVGPADEFIEILFPQAKATKGRHLTKKGASIQEVIKLFTPDICQYIEGSEQRIWEKEHQLLDSTGCVTMELDDQDPSYGTICVRIAFDSTMSILTSLYSG